MVGDSGVDKWCIVTTGYCKNGDLRVLGCKNGALYFGGVVGVGVAPKVLPPVILLPPLLLPQPPSPPNQHLHPPQLAYQPSGRGQGLVFYICDSKHVLK